LENWEERYFFRRYFGLRAIPMLIIVPGKNLTGLAIWYLISSSSLYSPSIFYCLLLWLFFNKIDITTIVK
jgi:hypothetical protein